MLVSPIDSSVEVAIMAKGEPLSYQWFCNDEPVDGATLPIFYLAQAVQPHNEGQYYCQIGNRKGQIHSTTMQLRVVDDRAAPDPTKAYRVDPSLLDGVCDVCCNVKAVSGSFTRHPSSAISLLLPPNFFECHDANGQDVSNSLGADIAIRNLCDWENAPILLKHGEYLVSCVVELLPFTVGQLLRPASLWIPHCLDLNDPHHQLKVVQVDPGTGRYVEVEDVGNAAQTTKNDTDGCVWTRISRFGRFAVVATRLPGNLQLEPPLEKLRLLFVRPRTISTSSIGKLPQRVSIWLIRDRPDVLNNWRAECKSVGNASTEPGEPQCSSIASDWVVDSFPVSVRQGQILTVTVDGADTAVSKWPMTTLRESHSVNDIVCVASEVTVSEDILNRVSVDEYAVFLPLSLLVAVRKPSRSTIANGSVALTVSNVEASSILLSEHSWTSLIPLHHDACAHSLTPTPILTSRTSTTIALDLDPTDETARMHPAELDDTKQEAARIEFSVGEGGPTMGKLSDGQDSPPVPPYYYVVEMATFSESFWTRYDQTWWFDKYVCC